MGPGSPSTAAAKCEDRIFGIVIEEILGLLRLHFLVGRGVERRKAEGIPSEPESSPEFLALAEEYRP